jgi:hypothetical protein
MTRLHVKLLAAAADSFPPVQHDRPAAVIIRAARPKVVYHVAVIISPALGRQGLRAGEQRRFGIVNDPSTWSPATGMPVACKSRAKGARQLPPGRAPSDSEARQLARHSPAATRTTGGRAGAGREWKRWDTGGRAVALTRHEPCRMDGEGEGTKARAAAAAAAAPIDGSMASRGGGGQEGREGGTGPGHPAAATPSTLGSTPQRPVPLSHHLPHLTPSSSAAENDAFRSSSRAIPSPLLPDPAPAEDPRSADPSIHLLCWHKLVLNSTPNR